MKRPIYKSLNHLRQSLNIPEINTNKQFSHTGCENGVFFTNNEILTAMSREDGKFIFKSATELTFNQYRGQIKHYNFKCSANLYRSKDLKSKFIEVCRTIAFEEFLEKHPFVQFINSLQDEIYINKTAIAQHYELKTPYLDLTSNFDVASFFATCELINGKYKPYKGNEYGVIYVFDEVLNHTIQKHGYDTNLEYVGWQPLPRPEQQRASTYKLKENEDFTNFKHVNSYLFLHNRSQSKEIWQKFDKGRILFPKDSIKEVAEIFKKLTSFTENEISEAKSRFSEWFDNFNDEDLKNIISDLEMIQIRENINWNNFVECSFTYWEKEYAKTLNKINYRVSFIVK